VISAGALVANPLTMAGAGFVLPGQTPVIQVAGQNVTVSGTPADTSLTVNLPVDADGGPDVSVIVSLNGKKGTPARFTVTPWLSRITPIRTTFETTTLVLRGIGFTTAPQAVRFEGPGGTTTVTSFNGPVTDTQAAVTMPATLAIGVYRVRIVLADGASNASNSATLEVIPMVASPIGVSTTTVRGSQVHVLTINGARLEGSDVRLIVDGATYATGANANATQIVFTLGRLLNSGLHGVAVVVNGSVSHTISLVIP
jgi:hypothetical protein